MSALNCRLIHQRECGGVKADGQCLKDEKVVVLAGRWVGLTHLVCHSDGRYFATLRFVAGPGFGGGAVSGSTE